MMYCESTTNDSILALFWFHYIISMPGYLLYMCKCIYLHCMYALLAYIFFTGLIVKLSRAKKACILSTLYFVGDVLNMTAALTVRTTHIMFTRDILCRVVTVKWYVNIFTAWIGPPVKIRRKVNIS